MPCAPMPRVLQWWLLSPASRPSTGGALGHGKCSPHNRQCSSLSMCINAQGLNFLRIVSGFTTVQVSPRRSRDTGDIGALAAVDHAFPPSSRHLMSPARRALTYAPQCSLSAGELFSHCASTSVVGRVHPHFVAIPYPHPIAPCPSNATSCVAVAAAAIITITTTIATATVATTTKVPRSNRHGPLNSNIALHHILASHRIALPGNAISCVALAATVTIAIITATVATTTKVPCSDGCCPWDDDIALHRTLLLHRPACQCSLSCHTHCCYHYHHHHHYHHCGHRRGTTPRRTQPCDSDITPLEVPEA